MRRGARALNATSQRADRLLGRIEKVCAQAKVLEPLERTAAYRGARTQRLVLLPYPRVVRPWKSKTGLLKGSDWIEIGACCCCCCCCCVALVASSQTSETRRAKRGEREAATARRSSSSSEQQAKRREGAEAQEGANKRQRITTVAGELAFLLASNPAKSRHQSTIDDTTRSRLYIFTITARYSS